MWLIVVVSCSHNGLGWKGPQRLPSSNPLPTVELLTARSSTNTTTRVFLPKFLIITFTQCYLTFLPVKTKKKRFSFYHEQLNHLWHSCVLSILDFLKFSVWRMEEDWTDCFPNWLLIWNAVVFPHSAVWLWTRSSCNCKEMQFCCGTAIYPKKFHFVSPNIWVFGSFGPWNTLYYKAAYLQWLGLNI